MSTVRVIPLAVKWTGARKGMAGNAYTTHQTGETGFDKIKKAILRLTATLKSGMMAKG